MMLIIALLASLVVTLTPGAGRAQLKAVSLETAALLRRERLDAILTGRARQVSIDNKQRALVGDGRDLVLIPRDVVLDVLGVQTNFGWDVDRSCASSQTEVLREPFSNCRAKRRNMKFASIGTRARSWLLPTDRNRSRAGYMLLEALVALALLLAFAAVLGPVLFQARRIMSDADDRIAAQALLRSLLDAPLCRATFAKSAREGETSGLRWRVAATPLHTDKPPRQRATSSAGLQGRYRIRPTGSELDGLPGPR